MLAPDIFVAFVNDGAIAPPGSAPDLKSADLR